MYQQEVKPIHDDVRPGASESASQIACGIPKKREAHALRNLQCAIEDLGMVFPCTSCFDSFKTNYHEMWIWSSVDLACGCGYQANEEINGPFILDNCCLIY